MPASSGKEKEELRLRNEKISIQNSELEEMNRQVKKMTVDRISFFTNLTHEFRTPITLIIGPVERALKLSNNPKVIEQLNFVERNSKYLLSLVNQLMDFRKLESGKMEIVPRRSNFVKFIDDVIPPSRHMPKRGELSSARFSISTPRISASTRTPCERCSTIFWGMPLNSLPTTELSLSTPLFSEVINALTPILSISV